MPIGERSAHHRSLARARACATRAHGFTYVWALAAVALFSIGLAVLGPMWSDATRRDREQELIRVGQIYAQAIANYYVRTPGSLKQYPQKLEELLLDERFWGTQRHLRKLHPDPLMPSRPWGLIRDEQGRIQGVYSQSNLKPFTQQAIDLGAVRLPVVDRYADWRFTPDRAFLALNVLPQGEAP